MGKTTCHEKISNFIVIAYGTKEIILNVSMKCEVFSLYDYQI